MKFRKIGGLDIPRWILLLGVWFLYDVGDGARVDTLANTTFFKAYTNLTTFPHLSFDTPLQERGKLVDYDETNVYLLSRESFSNDDTYKFMKVLHSNLTVTSNSVSISGYQLNGMGQYNGVLHYFVGLHTTTKELRVGNLYFNSTSSAYSALYCKAIPYTIEIEPLHIYSDCRYTGRDQEYIIAIGASAYDPAHEGQYNYMFAKFNTLYNITETLVESHDPTVSEKLVDTKVDLVNDLIYVVLQINSNEYLGRKIYDAEDEITENNPNVALVAYYISKPSTMNQNTNPDANGVAKWVKLFGDITYADYYAGLEENILVLNSYSNTTLDGSTTTGGVIQKDILAYKFRPETGYIEKKLVMGSPTDDEALSVVNHLHSTYILAKIHNNFLPHPTTGSIWGMDENKTYFGMIWINSKFELVDIEGYTVDSLETIPMQAFPSIPDVYEPQFMLFSPASKLEVNGLLITQFDTPLELFATNDCNLTGYRGNRYTKQEDGIFGDELKTEFLYKGECLAAGNIQTHQHTDLVSTTAKKHGVDCHYSCKNGLGPRSDQCSLCCANGEGGTSLLDRTPTKGEGLGPSGSYESHGRGLERCVNGLYGRLEGHCYESCPKNSYPELSYDGVSENEYTHYEYNNDTNGEDSSNLLQFNVLSKGIEIPGPPILSSMPKEFTLSFWAKATVMGSQSYLINLFDRVQIKIISSKVRFLFENGASTFIEPSYSGSLNQISTGNWFYVSVSQREHKNAGLHQIEQRIVIADGREVDAVEAGSKTDHTPVTFHKFSNIIFLGGLSYSSPNSFTGYLKEIRLFDQFHGSAQMINDRLRVYKIHSFDDPRLIAYWKLNEEFTNTDVVQMISDSSKHSSVEPLSVTFSPNTNSDYPSFILSNTDSLKLGYYHDVANCKALKEMPSILSKTWKLSKVSSFDVQSSSHTIEVGDTILIKNKDGQIGTLKLTLTRTINNDWSVDNTTALEIMDDGMHYSAGYVTLSDQNIDLGQLYITKTSTTIDPSDVSAFVILGLEVQIDVKGGDEGYGDIIRFSEDGNAPKTTDIFIERKTSNIYATLVTRDFQESKTFRMCHFPKFAQGSDLYLDWMNDHWWVAAETPKLGTNNLYTFNINDRPLSFEFDTPFTEGDRVAFAWKRDTDTDGNSANILSSVYYYHYGYFSLFWLGNDQGISGIDSNEKEEIHMCWISNSIGADPSYSRISLITGHNYAFITKEYSNSLYTTLPELSNIYPSYGSSELYGTDAQLQFSFGGENVFPAQRSGTNGKLGIYRGAITYDGEIILTPTSILYEISTLNEANSLTQGNIAGTSAGVGNITISTATSTGMAPGELYFIGFYPDSFSSNVVSNLYLFGNNTNGGNAMYYHLFLSRSFNIVETPSGKVFGSTLIIEGVNLLQISNVLAKQSGSGITNGTWDTKSIHIDLKISGSNGSSSLMPFGSVYMKNVNDTHITITNLDLKGCDNGNIHADFYLIRGIKQGINEWSHIREEYQKNVNLGTIGCDSSCISCTGPTSADGSICTNHATEYVDQGTCVTSCPALRSIAKVEVVTFESVRYEVKEGVASGGDGNFINTDRNEGQSCNLDCQIGENNKMFGCTTGNPIKYLYKEGSTDPVCEKIGGGLYQNIF